MVDFNKLRKYISICTLNSINPFIFRGDTCIIAGVFTGIEFGTWINYQAGLFHKTQISYPLSLDFSDYFSFIARTFVGLIIAGLTEFLLKYFSFSILCFVLNEDKKAIKLSENSVSNTKKNFIDLTSNFFSYCFLGLNIIIFVPYIFNLLNIQRSRIYHEL